MHTAAIFLSMLFSTRLLLLSIMRSVAHWLQSLFPKYTMDGWQYDPLDPYNKISVLALKSGLRNSLLFLIPSLRETVVTVVKRELGTQCGAAESKFYLISSKDALTPDSLGTICARIFKLHSYQQPQFCGYSRYKAL